MARHSTIHRVVPPTHITDIDDPRVEVFRDVRDKDLRGRNRLFMAESELVLRRLLRTPHRLHSVFLSQWKYEQLSEALAVLGEDVPIYVAEIELMTQIAGFHIHRGVLAAGVRPLPAELSLDAALGHLKQQPAVTLLIAEGLTNVDNMGGLFRNAAAFNVDGIVLDPSCCDPLYRKAIRVSMGHVLSVPWAVCEDWPGDLGRLKAEWDLTLVGAEVRPGAPALRDMPKDPRMALLFGSEGHGLSEAALGACDEVCQIPMSGQVPSINVAAACAVFLYELRR